MSIRLAILTAVDRGAVTSGEIIDKLAINGRSFHNSIRFMINQGRNHFTGYKITTLGQEKLGKKMIDSPPDYLRMRQYLQASFDISDSKLVDLSNDSTDFYLPYEGERTS